MGKRLYVGNLPYDTNDASLLAAFAEDGRKVERVHIVLDRDTGRPRGFAFVEMASDEDAKKAIAAMDGFMLNGRPLRVNEAEERRPGGGGGPGGPSRGPGGGGGYAGSRPAGGGARPAYGGGAPAFGSGADKPKYEPKYEKKNHKRKHDKEDDFEGPRGRRDFRDDEDA
jgi:RNA recognition motif-containing protein